MRFGGIVLAAVLTLGACTSDPEPREPVRTATSATPTVTPPTMPAQAKKDTPEGAAAFVKHYIDVFNYASNTGDVTELSRLSSPKCEGCQAYIELYRETYAAGGYFKGGDWTAGRIKLEFGGKQQFATMDVKVSRSRFKSDAGSAPKTSQGIDTRLSFGVARSRTDWTVTQLGLGGVH